MGLLSNIFGSGSQQAIKVEEGLRYRVADPFKVEVFLEPKWLEFSGESENLGKPTKASLAFIKKLNVSAICKTESEAFAVTVVLENMKHFCEHCGNEVYTCDTKCFKCNKPLWKGRKKIQMVVVQVPPALPGT